MSLKLVDGFCFFSRKEKDIVVPQGSRFENSVLEGSLSDAINSQICLSSLWVRQGFMSFEVPALGCHPKTKNCIQLLW